MSSVILNSNQNSALVNTLSASASLTNPQVYQTLPLYPPHSVTYSSNDPSNGGTPVKGNSTVFQLNKYGIISQILFTYKKSYTNNTGGAITAQLQSPQNDFFNCVEKVELLSSSRVISTLTKVDFMAQFSDLPTNKMSVIAQNLLKPQEVNALANSLANGATTPEVSFTAPLVFGFMKEINTQLNASFLEPLSIRVTWATNWDRSIYTGAVAGLVGNVLSPQLSVRYKNYQEDANAKIISENFANPQLNLLSTQFKDEVRESVLNTSGSATLDASIEVELKNTECVENFYVILLKSNPTTLAGANVTTPSAFLEATPHVIKSVSFTGSGQEIVNLDSRQLAYARLDTDGFSVGQEETINVNKLSNVAKFQTGVYHEGVMSNTISLREINNPRIKVTFDMDNDANRVRYYLYVVEDCSAIYSITSATGSLQVSLSN